jgi:hypothetical protein
MGVRLYPVYDSMNKELEEILAGVPVGTSLVLNELDICLQSGKLTDVEYFDRLQSVGNENASRLNHFRSFGYGKLTNETIEYFKSHGFDTENGTTLDPHQIEDLLHCQGDRVYGGVLSELPRGRVSGLSWY